MPDAAVRIAGRGRIIGAAAAPSACTVTLEPDRLTVEVAGNLPLIAAYRDLATIATQPGSTLLVFGSGPDAVRVVLDQIGDRVGRLLGELRERRSRQRLADALVEPADDPFELVEYRIGSEHAVAQVAFGPWGAELLPLDERLAWRRIRRADIVAVSADGSPGVVAVDLASSDPAVPPVRLELLGLGDATTRWAASVGALRDSALRDAATLVAGLVPDAAFGMRQRLSRLLVDGRPAGLADLGADGPALDAAVLSEPVFAASFRALLERAGAGAPRWFAMAPERPGSDARKAWYLVGLPGNLIALELVSEGAHATYCFRVAPRATWDPATAAGHGAEVALAARAVSGALIDARFLREPMALPDAAMADAGHLRYRLAIAALPSLADARRRFVARLVHDDPARWGAALDDLVAWHGACRDEAAEWPGRSGEESRVSAAASDDPTPTASTTTAPVAGTGPADPGDAQGPPPT